MKTTWKHDEIFPIIANVIKRQYGGDQRYIPAPEIASELLRDTEAIAIITRAQSQQSERWPANRLATTMVAWFSQQIRVGKSPWKDRFERIKIDGQRRQQHPNRNQKHDNRQSNP